MISRRKRQSESERLLAEGPQQAPEPKTAETRAQGNAHRRFLIVGGIVFLLFAGLHFVAHLAWWAVPALLLLTVGLNTFFARSLPKERRPKTSPLRGLFLFWFAISVAITVLVAISGYRSDLILVVIVWAILIALWLADRGLVRPLRA